GADSDQALTGECFVGLIPQGTGTDDDGDFCGDFDGDPLAVVVNNVTAVCTDSNGDGFFDLALCASWDNNSNTVCADAGDAIPGTAAKCACVQVETSESVPHCADPIDPFPCSDDSNPCTDTVCNSIASGLGDINGCSQEPNNNLCRGSAGECDVAENCTAGQCPADDFEDAGEPCSSDDEICTDDVCNGSGTCVHNPNTAPCNDGLFCTENDACSGGECTGSAIDCSDAIDCTDDTCNEAGDTCVNTPNNGNCEDGDNCTADICSIQDSGCTFEFTCGTDICRSPGYWATHSGYEKNNSINVGQLVIDAAGPLEVCGETITTTSNGGLPYLQGLGLTSNLEGLCMRAKGVPQRRLYRQLMAAALNCGISGGDCDAILGKYVDVSFSDCSDLCAGNPVQDGPTLGQCVSQLDCFNNGGLLVEGECVLDLPGNCHDAPLCNEALGVCPKSTPASSPKACREARHNDCSIDDCF
ncbi:MAG: hypothetical protein ABR587_06420, partial [Candidatus Binatia bacterium]